MTVKTALLIFDLDDTLVHSRIDFPTLAKWVQGQLISKRLTNKIAGELSDLSVSQMLKIAEEYDRRKATNYARALWDKVIEFEQEGMRRATVEPDVWEALNKLKDYGFVLTVLTNNARSAAAAVLKRFDLAKFFDAVIAREEAGELKPNPAGFLLLKKRYQGSVNKMYAIGDSWIDGAAAQEAGVPFIGFNFKQQKEISMVASVSNLAQLVNLLINNPSSD